MYIQLVCTLYNYSNLWQYILCDIRIAVVVITYVSYLLYKDLVMFPFYITIEFVVITTHILLYGYFSN